MNCTGFNNSLTFTTLPSKFKISREWIPSCSVHWYPKDGGSVIFWNLSHLHSYHTIIITLLCFALIALLCFDCFALLSFPFLSFALFLLLPYKLALSFFLSSLFLSLFVDPYLHNSLPHSLCVSFFSSFLFFLVFLFSFFLPYTFSVKLEKSPIFSTILSDNTTLHEHKRIVSIFGPGATTHEQLTEPFHYEKSPSSLYNNIYFICSYSMAVI